MKKTTTRNRRHRRRWPSRARPRRPETTTYKGKTSAGHPITIKVKSNGSGTSWAGSA